MSYFYDDDDDDDDPFVPDEEQDKEEEEESSSDNRSDQVRKQLEEMKKREQEAQNRPQSSDTGSKGSSGQGGKTSSQGSPSKGPSEGGTGTPGKTPGGMSGSGTQAGTTATSTSAGGTGVGATTTGAGATTTGAGATATGAGATAAGTGAAAAGTGAAAGGAAATAGVAAGAAAAWPVLLIILIVVIIIVLIICFIGVYLFIQTMPGAVMEKLKDMARSVGNAFTSFFGEGEEEQVDPKQIYEVMDYLEEMEYDLKGYGFLTKFVGDETDAEDDGVERDENGLINNAESDFINQYLVSDNYMYTIANFNTNTDHWWEALFDHVSAIFTDSLKNRTGMLAIYHDGGTIGSSSENLYDALERGYIKADAESKTLTIKKGWTNNPMKYSLDGWTGRYGMPLEFLLSVHMATMMPDLAYDMATAFDTQVKILLHEIKNGEVAGTYKTESGQYVTYETVSEAINGLAGKNIFSAIITAIDEWGLNNSEAQALLDLGIVPPDHNPPECGCELSGDTTLYYGDHPVFEDEDGYYYETYEDNEEGTSTNVKDIVKVYLEEGQEPVAKTGGTIKKIGSKCKEYLKAAVKYMRKDNDYDYGTFVPYIEKVTDHWYRDVYFIANSNQNFVDYDYDYESVMRERWTLYETYGTDTPEKMGEYKLYALNKSGDYAKSLSDVYVEDDSKRTEAQSKIDSSTMLFDGTYEDAAQLTIHVAKKATTIKIGDEYEDLKWNEVGSGVYSAYSTEESTTSDYQQIYHEGVDTYDKAGETAKKAMDHIYSLVQIGNITQTGEGQRTETNSKIKKMFLENRYFRFDGDSLKAEAIVALREKYSLPYGPLQKDENTPYTDEELENMTVELTKDGDKANATTGSDVAKFNARQLSGNVSINQESLDAFTMLENTHTLDADYIYRDFKELIVELGYFEKEELTDETPRVMEFPVPEIGSGGYPNRSIDKKETEYGTMIHSKGDIDANEKASLLALIDEEMGSEIPEDIADEQYNNAPTLHSKPSMTLGNGIKIDEVGSISDGGETKSVSQVSIEEFLQSTREMCEYINQEGYDYCVLVGDAGNGKQHCDHAPVHGNPCSLPTTFAASQESVSKHNFCCATLVSWALQNVGIMPDSAHQDGADNLAKWIENNLDPEKIEVGQPLEPGDILCYSGHIDLVGEEIEGGFVKYNGGHYTEAGSVENSGSSCITHISGWPNDSRILFALRLNWGKSAKSEPYTGYNGNEAVVSPVTGILLEYGTYDPEEDIDNIVHEPERVNVDLRYGNLVTKGLQGSEEASDSNVSDPNANAEPTGEIQSDKVGYAKILVLNADYYKALESMTDNRWKKAGISLVNTKKQDSEEGESIKSYYSDYNGGDLILSEKKQIEDDNWSEIDKLVYGYKEFAETYEYAGIGGYIVYIDGFVCEEPDEEFTEEDIKDKIPYQENSGAKSEAQISLDRYKEITADVVNSTSDDSQEKMMESLYESPDEYKMASKKATDKLNAELAVKSQAASSIFIPNVKIDDETKDAIFIKEGTILGRTMTDRELITEIREQDEEKLKEYRPSFFEENAGASGGTGSSEDEEGPQDKVMGNYIRTIMRDLDGTPVENVEDYMKLDEASERPECQFEQLAYFLGCLEEGFYESMDNGNSYGTEVLKDGAGNTTAFGLTKAVSKTANNRRLSRL